ncbi:MAG TPA: HEAT repeat domain-containing protein [Acidobacteriota bacterium]|nr:HEAT repeat domain-containing protein [Acidobacteriota bacterium]
MRITNNFPNKNHWRAFRLFRFGALVLFTAVPARGAFFQRPQFPVPPPAPQQPQKPALLRVRVDEGSITATIVDSKLQSVLEDLAARTGVIFEVRSQENPLVSVRLSRVPLQEAIQRIAPGYNAIYVYSQNPNEPDRIALVRLFPRTGNTPQPSIAYLGTGAITKDNDTADTSDQALKILEESQSVEVRSRAVETLIVAGDSRAINGLMKAISDPSPLIRVSVIEGLASLNVRDALPSILKSLKDSNPAVRRSAATAVALLGTARNIKDLKPLSEDRDGGVAAAAEAAIRRLSTSVKK